MFAQLSPEAAGLSNIDAQNPWIAAGAIESRFAKYEPLVAHELRWLAPIAALAWIVISSFGRNFAFRQMDPRVRLRPLAMMVLQTVWLALFGAVCWGWFRSMIWVAVTHFPAGAEPDLIGFSVWLIFLSLAFFTVWALLGWIVSVAPVLMLLENRSAVSALAITLEAGKDIHLRAVRNRHGDGHREPCADGGRDGAVGRRRCLQRYSAATLHVVWAGAAVFYLVAHDYFQLVRLKCFVEFWKIFRGTRP